MLSMICFYGYKPALYFMVFKSYTCIKLTYFSELSFGSIVDAQLGAYSGKPRK